MNCIFKKYVILHHLLLRNVVLWMILKVHPGNKTNELKILVFHIQYMVIKVKEKFEKTRNIKKMINPKSIICEEKEV